MNSEVFLPRANPLQCSVVVTTWQRPLLLQNTLNSLIEQSYRNIEILVVCDGESKEVRAIEKEYPPPSRIRWTFHPENRGLPAARNTGAREATGDIVLFLDDDVEADSELVAAHMQQHNTASEYRRIAVRSLASEDRASSLDSFLNERLHELWKQSLHAFASTFSAMELDSVGEAIEQSVCFGLNCSIRRDIFLRLGGFNESFRASDEEMELGMRLYLAGIEFVFEPRILLTHKNTKNLESYFRNCWKATGVLDTHRVFELKQRDAQTSRLAEIFHGYLLDRLTARFKWHLSGPLLSLSRQLAFAANRTHSKALAGAWGRIAQAGEYWTGAKSAGCTLPQLKSVIGPTRRAMMLHSICEPLSGEEASYYIEPRRFHRLMKWFHFAGYKTATLDQWLRDDLADNQVLLTFDDAYDDLYEELLPLVIQRRYTPVIFLVADSIGSSNVWDQPDGLRARNLLSLAQIREMQKYGVEFGSHTLTHPWLPNVSDAQLQSEVTDSKHRLEDLLGIEITSFAYPYGGVDQRVRSAVARAGYKLAFTVAMGSNWWNDPLCQRRAEINSFTSVLDFAAKLKNGQGIADSLSARMRNLQQNVPTRRLRGFIGGFRATGHSVRQVTSAERKNALKTQKQR